MLIYVLVEVSSLMLDNDDDTTTITVRVRNREWLKSLGRKGQTYWDILDIMQTMFRQKNIRDVFERTALPQQEVKH